MAGNTIGDQSDRGQTIIPSHHYMDWDSELHFITSRDRHHLRKAYSNSQQARLLNWIDEIKLSHRPGSKIRDHLDLDDRNLFKMKNPVNSNTMRHQPEEDDWDDDILLPQREKEGELRQDFQGKEWLIQIEQDMQPLIDDTQQWLSNARSRTSRPGETEKSYIDQDVTMQPIWTPVAPPAEERQQEAEGRGRKGLRSLGFTPDPIMLPQVKTRGQPQTFAIWARPLMAEELQVVGLGQFKPQEIEDMTGRGKVGQRRSEPNSAAVGVVRTSRRSSTTPPTGGHQ